MVWLCVYVYVLNKKKKYHFGWGYKDTLHTMNAVIVYLTSSFPFFHATYTLSNSVFRWSRILLLFWSGIHQGASSTKRCVKKEIVNNTYKCRIDFIKTKRM